MVSSGLTARGFQTLLIDDCWQVHCSVERGTAIPPVERSPSTKTNFLRASQCSSFTLDHRESGWGWVQTSAQLLNQGNQARWVSKKQMPIPTPPGGKSLFIKNSPCFSRKQPQSPRLQAKVHHSERVYPGDFQKNSNKYRHQVKLWGLGKGNI